MDGTKVDTTQLAWDFCSQHSLPQRPVCKDSPLLMIHDGEYQDCAWAGQYSSRCDLPRVRTHCPETCSVDELLCFDDSEKTFVLQGNGLEKDW